MMGKVEDLLQLYQAMLRNVAAMPSHAHLMLLLELVD
jgi:hypothetical protein